MSYKSITGGFRQTAIPGWVTQSTEWFNLNSPYPDPGNSDFRLFLPPGTVAISLSWNCPSDVRVGTVSRLGHAPDFNSSVTDRDHFDSLPWEGDNGANRSQLIGMDCFARNVGGHASVAYWTPSNYPPMPTGLWLYSKLIQLEGRISNVHPTITVMAAPFFRWFNTHDLWDANGDPIVGMIPTGPAKPTTPGPIISLPGGGGGEIPEPSKPGTGRGFEFSEKGMAQMRELFDRLGIRLGMDK